MKKIVYLLAFVMLACFSASSMAAPSDKAENRASDNASFNRDGGDSISDRIREEIDDDDDKKERDRDRDSDRMKGDDRDGKEKKKQKGK